MEIEAQETPACLRGSDVARVNIVLDLVYLEFLGRGARGETTNCLLFSGGWLGAHLMAKDMRELAGPGPLAHTSPDSEWQPLPKDLSTSGSTAPRQRVESLPEHGHDLCTCTCTST